MMSDEVEVIKQPNEEALKAAQAKELKDWIETAVPNALRSVAERYGRELFCFAMQTASLSVGLTQLSARLDLRSSLGRQSQELLQAVAGNANALGVGLMIAKGWTSAMVAEVQMDCQRAHELAGAAAEAAGRVSAGGLILPTKH